MNVDDLARGLWRVLVAVATVSFASLAWCQGYPSKPVRLIVAQGPGAAVDAVARILSPELASGLGQPVIVENKPGAGQLLGFEYVAKQAPADGHTLLVLTVSTLAILPVTVKELRFDPLRDLPPVIGLTEGRFILGSSSKLSWTNFNEFVAFAKARPGKLNYGSPAPIVRLPIEAIVRGLGLDVVHIPYTAAAPYFLAISTGEVQLGFVNESQALTFGDRFRALATTGERRSAPYMDVPTMSELGFPQVTGLVNSLNVRAGTPRPIVDRLYAITALALKSPDVRARYEKLQLEVLDQPAEKAARRLAEDAKLFSDIARTIGFLPE